MNNRQQDTSSKLTILYERLSVEDERSEESNSIKNQKDLLESYAKKQGFRNIVHITDDGHSGTRFDRPGFLEALELVESGRVENWVVKDLSRFGRDHIRVGLYTERLRECGVRFIAIGDNVDTAVGEDDFVPFRNIINEWAARDSSRKVKAVMKSKGMSGKRLTSAPIYGYTCDPDDKTRWVIDPEASVVVQRIYQMTIEGMGPQVIAKALSMDKVERPSYYLNRRGIARYKYPMDKPYLWNGATVSSIISKPEYTGATVNFRSYKASYKDKTAKKTPKDDWAIFPGTHDAIIEPETWETAQKCRKTMKRTDSLGEANPLTGKMLCADCGARMYNHRQPNETPYYTNHNTGKAYMRGPSDIYSCSTHSRSGMKFEQTCSLHYIRTAAVRELVLNTIRNVSGYVRGNTEEFARRVREESVIRQDETAKAHRKRISKNDKRIAELDLLFRKTYEDNATGKLSDERFRQLTDSYELEQAELKQQNAGLQAEVDGYDADSEKADRFIGLVQRYTDFTELTSAMINEFVDRIYVHECDRSSGKREQLVDIHLNFIGAFAVPAAERVLSLEELKAEQELDALRAKRREYNRRYQAKRKIRDKVLMKVNPADDAQSEQQTKTA